MRITTLVAALWSLVKSLWPFARMPVSPASQASPANPRPMPEPVPVNLDDGVFDPNQPQAGTSLREASGQRDELSGNQPEGGLLDDEPPPHRIEHRFCQALI